MSHTIVGKLNKDANQFQAGESVGFNVRIGVQYYDRETRQKEWTNYSGVIFAKQASQIQFYQSALTEGAIVELTGQQIKIDKYEGQNGLSLTLELIDAKLGYVHNPQGQQQQPQQGFAQQPAQQQAPQQAPTQQFQPQSQPQNYNQQPQQPQTPAQVQQMVDNGQGQRQPQAQQTKPQYSEPPAGFDNDIPY